MKATQTQITDFNIGAIGRTLVEGPAAELDEFYQQAFNLVSAAIPVSVYTSFSFNKLPPLSASGLIRVAITAQPIPTLIPGGSQLKSPTTTNVYASSADVLIPAGNTYADVPVAATTAGTTGNLASGVTFTMTPAINGFISATNLSAFVNGRDIETDAEQQIRFNDFISTLPRGTPPAINYGLSLVNLTDSSGNVTERVVFKNVIEPYVTDNTQPIALVEAYIHNGVGSTSSQLVAQANKIIYGYYLPDGTAVPGWKAAGVPVNIYPATEAPLAVTGIIDPADGYDPPTLCGLAQTAIFTYLQNLGIGVPALYAEMVALVMGIPGVTNFTMSVPAAGVDTASTPKTKIMPGVISITAAA